jgi:hypothetical protein
MSTPNSRQSTSSSGSRSSSRISNPDIFSDEYALEPLDVPEVSPFDADDDPTPTSTSHQSYTTPDITRPISPDQTTSNPIPSLPTAYRSIGVRDVDSIIPKRSSSGASNTFSDVHRASSTSSHFSMPRSQSPYVGATGPSHPYGMYPQITRTSSIASASTVRPVERPFVAPSGPEHPYAMYTQNTVPEEEDVSLSPVTIPVGFPGMAQQRSAPRRRDDIADIVGSDGHIEELPPYTRYANEVAPKERRPSLDVAPAIAAAPSEVSRSPETSRTQFSETGVELNTGASRNAESDSSGSFKEKFKERSRRRICCGLPFWFMFVILGVLLFGVILGAIIGGVVGSRKGALSNHAADALQNTSYAQEALSPRYITDF